jgi:hypothetical protein
MSAANGFDWQFLVVTLAAGWGVWALARPLLRLRAAKRAERGCAHCAAGNPCASGDSDPEPKLVTLGAGSPRRSTSTKGSS